MCSTPIQCDSYETNGGRLMIHGVCHGCSTPWRAPAAVHADDLRAFMISLKMSEVAEK